MSSCEVLDLDSLTAEKAAEIYDVLKKKQPPAGNDDLDSLFGKWSQQDFEAIQAEIDGERHIDPEIWK